jgi:hypothetical protein
MKKIINYLLSLFGFGKKNNEVITPSENESPKPLSYWELRNYVCTPLLRDKLLIAFNEAKAKNPNAPFKYDSKDNQEYDLRIDLDLIAPYKSQTDKVMQVLLWNAFISDSAARSAGLRRLPKIISELRKKNWDIKTFLLYQNGIKTDTIYVLLNNELEMLAGETAVVK